MTLAPDPPSPGAWGPERGAQLPMSAITPHPTTVKAALKRNDLSEPFLVGKYRLSPYMGCEHGCLYCDGRAERYYVQGRFERDIVVRSNLPELLARDIERRRERGFVVVGSGITDAYQPIEATEQLTRRCAEVLAEADLPVTVLTKSALAMRDLDLWARVQERAGFVLAVSLAFADERTRRVFEPRASTVQERLDLLRAFKARGCTVGVLAMPLLPLVADAGAQIQAVFEAAAAVPVDFIVPGGTTLRPGRQKAAYCGLLAAVFPHLLGPTLDIYREERPSGAPLAAYRRALHERCGHIQRAFGLPGLLPHRVYQGQLQRYDEIHVLLHHMRDLYAARGVDIRPLAAAIDRYGGWLEPRKRIYNRHPSWTYEALDDELRGHVRSGRMAQMLDNERLAAFLAEVVLDRRTLDYATLELVRDT